METADHEGKLLEHRFQYRQQPKLGNLWRRRHNLPLGDFVYGIDVIHPFVAILIPLMHRIDTQVSGQALWSRLAALPDGDRRRPRGLVTGVALAISVRTAQAVQVCHRDPRQPLVNSLAVFVALPLQNAPRGWAAQV